MKHQFLITAVFGILCAGCAGIPIEERSPCGPSGIGMWKYRQYPYKTSKETDEYEEQLDGRINKYLLIHPEVQDPQLWNFKELRVVIEGMNEEMVEILYGPPDEVSRENLKYNAEERWLYKARGGTKLYFNKGIVVAIETKYYMPIVP